MFARLGTLSMILFWSASTGWLIWHDVWPAWTAQDPPQVVAGDWIRAHGGEAQAAIRDRFGWRVGTIWTKHTAEDQGVHRHDTIFIERFPYLRPTWITIDRTFLVDEGLDEFDVVVHGYRFPMRLHGERFLSEFAFELRVGTMWKTFKLDRATTAMIGDCFRPFAALPGLEVGQSWRMQVLNLLSLVSANGLQFTPVLVRVDRMETLDRGGQAVRCFVVTAPQVTAWVDGAGRVLKQEVELPVGGVFTVQDEPFDPDARVAGYARFSQQLVDMGLDPTADPAPAADDSDTSSGASRSAGVSGSARARPARSDPAETAGDR